MADYGLTVAPSGRRCIERLPEKIRPAVGEFISGALCADPHRVGKPLRYEMTGRWVARRGPYRVIYRIDDENREVTVLRIDHRAHVYRS